MEDDVKQRLEKLEQRNDQLFGKIESVHDSYRTLQSTIGEINLRLSQIAQAVEKMSGLAEKSIQMSEVIKNTQNDIEILFRDFKEVKAGGLPLCQVHSEKLESTRRECEEKIKTNKEDCEKQIKDIKQSLAKRDGYFMTIIISMFTVLVGFVIWYIQNIGDK